MASQINLGPSEITRLKALIEEGVRTLEELDSLREGMSETVKAISEELNLPSKLLKKAISVAHKGSYADEEDFLKDLEKVLLAVGKR